MTVKYQYRVEIGSSEFVFAVGAEALSFARLAVEHFKPSKYYNQIRAEIILEEITEDDDVPEEGEDD